MQIVKNEGGSPEQTNILGNTRDAYKMLVGKTEGNGPFGKLKALNTNFCFI
jgi:hypothetical protein